MEKNIFEGAKFGDKFLTRDGRIAIYRCYSVKWHNLIMDGEPIVCVNNDGIECFEHHKDIVSKYQEQIDEEKLDELAENNSSWCDITDTEGISGMDIRNAYKAGYRDAFKNGAISH